MNETRVQPVVIASSNRGKLQEFQVLLENTCLEPISSEELGVALDVEEAGSSYRENALLKARAYAAAVGMSALADDSGIEVDALNGAPGLYSARYGGPGLTDAQRVTLVLERLRGREAAARTARFRCALVLCAPDGRYIEGEGVCEGIIADAPRGSHGFGYDPIFLLPGLSRTMAELSEAEKNGLSHRAMAVRSLLEKLGREPEVGARFESKETK
jgi:XTP/dITP diphosphohydrolase